MNERARLGWIGLLVLSLACLAMPGASALGIDIRPTSLAFPQAGLPGRLSVAVALSALGIGIAAYGTLKLLNRIRNTNRFVARLLSPETTPSPEIEQLLHQLGLQGWVAVVAEPQPLVFCFGYLRPRLCLSTGLLAALPTEQLRAVLSHERHHLERRHPLLTLVLRTMADTFFFLPVLGETCHYLMIRMELTADVAAIQAVGRKSLAAALHKLSSRKAVSRFDLGLALSDLNPSRARIEHLLGGPTPGWRPSLAASSSTVAALSSLCLVLMAFA